MRAEAQASEMVRDWGLSDIRYGYMVCRYGGS
jgi:hypothetical protein